MDELFIFLFNMLLHPRIVHFPIALLLTGVFLIFSNELIKKTQLNDLSIKMIVIGWILTIPAILRIPGSSSRDYHDDNMPVRDDI